MTPFKYRPDVDGLRALAIIPVIFYHANLGFPGGYVGVDVFFVISGFLITSILLGELRAGTFSYAGFWERRARRILPAATVTVLTVLAAGYVILLPHDFQELGESAAAQSVFSANFFFWRDSGYFDAPAESKPLLHLWSLAVEEQFYFLLPAFLVFAGRFGERARLPALAIVAAASFVLSLLGVAAYPNATFYLLPTRAWELLLGSIVAALADRPCPSRKLAETLGWLGLALILVPALMYDRTTLFPGAAALPPCLGTALLIWSSAGHATLPARALAHPALVFIGLLSYSLYLWHWPVIVYANYWTAEGLPVAARLGLIALGVVLAWLSWTFVETPFRKKVLFKTRFSILTAAGASLVMIVGLGVTIALQQGLPTRLPSQAVQYANAVSERSKIRGSDLTLAMAEAGNLAELAHHENANTRVLLWGDSHARVISPAVEEVCRQLRINGYRASRSATPPLLGWGDEESQAYNDAVFRSITEKKVSTVILVARWELRLQSDDDGARLAETIRSLQAAGVRVCLMRQVPMPGFDVPKALAQAILDEQPPADVGVPVREHASRFSRANAMIDRAVGGESNVAVLDPVTYFADPKRGIYRAEYNGKALYYDNQHLTLFGANLLKPMFERVLRSIPPNSGHPARAASFHNSRS